MAYFEDVIKIRKKFMLHYKKGNYVNCISIGQKLIDLYKKHEDMGSIDYADDLYNLACIYHETGGFAQARPLYVESVKLVRKLLGKGISYTDRLNNLAVCIARMGESDMAAKYLKEAAHILVAKGYENSPQHLETLYNLANVYYDQGLYDEAIRQHVNVLFTRKDEGDGYSDSLNCIGYAYERQGDLENAVNYIKRATAHIKKTHTVNSMAYLSNIYYLAQIYIRRQDYPSAIRCYEDAQRVIRKLFNEKHPYFADTLNRLAEALENDGQWERALRLRLRALKIVRIQIGEQHMYYANCLRNIGLIYKTEGEKEKAVPYFLQALAIKRQIIGAGNIDYIRDVMFLCGIYIERFEYESALNILNDTMQLLELEGGEFDQIVPEINKIFSSLKSIQEFKENYQTENGRPMDIAALLKLVEDRISEDGGISSP